MRALLPTLLGLSILGVSLLGLTSAVPAEIFHSRESALRLAFPAADSVSVEDLVLSVEEAERVERRAGVALESRLVSVYSGWSAGERTAWAFLDTHTVRTLPETFLVVLESDGRVRATHLLAFHEPPEYQPDEHWLEQFAGHGLDRDLAVGYGIAGIGGSTLTARAVTASVRRLLAVWQVVIAERAPTAAAPAPASADRS